MTKILIILGLFISLPLFAANEDEPNIPVCSLYYLKSVKAKVEAQGQFDKYKHCAVSCLLALRCPASDVLEIGILKELADVLGPGNAEIKDFKADQYGVNLVISDKVKTDKACIHQCHKIYPEK